MFILALNLSKLTIEIRVVNRLSQVLKARIFSFNFIEHKLSLSLSLS